MDTSTFQSAYAESRNGCNHFIRHPLARNFIYSDGVGQCADAGCHWLLDILGTEFTRPLRESNNGFGIIEVLVGQNYAEINLTLHDDQPPAYTRKVEFTDMPDGRWLFYMTDEGEHFSLILPSEY